MTLSVVIAAGGTGGHLVPALAVADALRRARPEVRISFVGTSRAVDRDIVARAGERSYVTSVQPFTRSARGVLAPLSLLPATAQARRVLRREEATVAIGMGGYPSVPVIVAARIARVPSLIHEANAVPGLANELAARFTGNVAVSFPGAAASFAGRAVRVTGVPLRPAFEGFDRERLRAQAWEAFELDPTRGTVLVFGGSLGAARLNAAALGLAERWRGREDLQILHAAGATHAERVAAEVAGSGLRARVLPFIDRMDLAYAVADVCVARAGASTVAELAATGVPSVLVPLPVARRREQHANAAELAATGGAIVVEDGEATAARMGPLIEELFADPDGLAKMGGRARDAARPGAAAEVAAWALELAEAS